MTLIQITLTLKANYVRSKIIYYLIASPRFQEAFASACKDHQELVTQYIKKKDKRKILIWLYKETGYLPIGRLRSLSKDYAIKNYLRSTPRVLLKVLRQYLTEEEILDKIYNDENII